MQNDPEVARANALQTIRESLNVTDGSLLFCLGKRRSGKYSSLRFCEVLEWGDCGFCVMEFAQLCALAQKNHYAGAFPECRAWCK